MQQIQELANPDEKAGNMTSYSNSGDLYSDWRNISYDDDYLAYLNSKFLLQELNLDDHFDMRPLNIMLMILYGVVFIVGLLGNIFVIMVIIKFKSMRTLTNFFLVNLTVGDILVILICIPVTLGNTIYKKWIYGEILCKLAPFIQGSAVGVSVLSLLAISVSRYFAIYKPLTAKFIFSTRNTRCMLFAIWVISLGSFTPILFVNSVTTFGLPGIFESKICEEKWDTLKDKHIYNVFIFSILFLWPFALMALAYSIIGHTLWIGNSVLFHDQGKSHQKQNNLILKQRRRTVKMLVCVIVIFGCCWLPYYIVNLWMDFNLKDTSKAGTMETVSTYVYPLMILLGLANSAVNPICYCFMSHGFRRGFNKMFCTGFRKRSGTFLGRTSWKFKTIMSESVETAHL